MVRATSARPLAFSLPSTFSMPPRLLPLPHLLTVPKVPFLCFPSPFREYPLLVHVRS